VSIVEVDPQALLIIGIHIVKNGLKNIVVFIMMSGESLVLWASCSVHKIHSIGYSSKIEIIENL